MTGLFTRDNRSILNHQVNDCVNTLYLGDYLYVLRENIPSESVDLVYIDPPFNSRSDYTDNKLNSI
jgi:16S rRNA G966 N2-methylase RsmD